MTITLPEPYPGHSYVIAALAEEVWVEGKVLRFCVNSADLRPGETGTWAVVNLSGEPPKAEDTEFCWQRM